MLIAYSTIFKGADFALIIPTGGLVHLCSRLVPRSIVGAPFCAFIISQTLRFVKHFFGTKRTTYLSYPLRFEPLRGTSFRYLTSRLSLCYPSLLALKGTRLEWN